MSHHLRGTCRACDSTDLEAFLRLGPTPLANSFLRSAEEAEDEAGYPLDVYFCPNCSLVQLLDVISPEVLFRDYIYVTGTSETMARHNVGYAQDVVNSLGLGPEDLVVEIASNDGSLLDCFREHGVRTLGVEPARNIAELARERGIETVAEFFGHGFAKGLRADRGPARAVIANNVLAHVDETRDFLAGCAELIDEDGRVVIEFPYLGDLLDHFEYDTVYHEHLCYFSVTAILVLYQAVGMVVERIDRVPVHGGSLRVWGALQTDDRTTHGEAVLAMAAAEREAGYDTPELYRAFARDVAAHREKLLALLADLQAGGARIAGYGAPAKGNTLLNYCGIGTRTLAYTVDRNPLKVGLLAPGSHIPVKPVETLLEDQPDYVLILAWNFGEEIMRQQAEYAERGGRFILPIPDPRVVTT